MCLLPWLQAVCCPDKLHCCAKGQKCNEKTGECENSNVLPSLPWLSKVPASKPLPPVGSEVTESSVLCPDKKSTCPDKTTCCRLTTGKYGCCPMPKVWREQGKEMLKGKVQPSGGPWDIRDWWQILGSGHMYKNTSDHRGHLA